MLTSTKADDRLIPKETRRVLQPHANYSNLALKWFNRRMQSLFQPSLFVPSSLSEQSTNITLRVTGTFQVTFV